MNVIASLASFAAGSPFLFFVTIVLLFGLGRALIAFLGSLLRPCAQCLIEDAGEWSCLDDFAAAAMQSLLERGERDPEDIAVRSYVIAGAMNKARAQ